MLLLLAGMAFAEQPNKRLPDLERGEQLYRRHCVSCHGKANDGKGPVSASLVTPVPDLAGKLTADSATQNSISYGKNTMPAFRATFNNRDAMRALQFMVTLSAAQPLKPVEDKPKQKKKKPAYNP